MDGTLVTFGDVFRYNEEFYVYLALNADAGILYAARILNEGQTKAFDKMSIKSKIDDEKNLTFCYVMLKTENFKNRAAHFYQNEHESSNIYIEKFCSLDKEDLIKIKAQVMDSKAISQNLKDAVKDITLS